jgi:short-subunit dehydrogenase
LIDNQGLGQRFAHAFGRFGLRLVLVARGRDALEAVAAAVRAKHNVDVVTIVADLSKVEVCACVCVCVNVHTCYCEGCTLD